MNNENNQQVQSTLRETRREVTLQGRTFVISKMPCMTSVYLGYLIMTSALPGIIEAKIGITGMGARTAMSPKDFNLVMGDSLSVISEVLPAGNTPVLNSEGKFAVSDLDTNGPLVTVLVAHSLKFNLEGFFTEGLWKESGLFPQDINEPEQEMSTNTSSSL